MPKLRKFCAYRRIERPYTRVSKYRKKAFIKVRPPIKLLHFDMGTPQKTFDYEIDLVPKESLQIRHNALESARMICNKSLEENIGKTSYFFKVKVYPFHILRENPLAAGAGADRMSTGMAHSWGKPIGAAAQVQHGKPVFTIHVNKEHMDAARKALKAASHKLPLSYQIVEKIKK